MSKIQGKKNGTSLSFLDLSQEVTAGGFEPPTLRAEIWYSIQLNYAAENKSRAVLSAL